MVKRIQDFHFKGKRVLVRCDFNVPLDQTGNILDDFRIKKIVPTVKHLIQEGAKVILMSHLGEPKGQVREDLRLSAVGIKLVELLGREVQGLPDCVGGEVEQAVGAMKSQDVILLENLRFHKEEEENDAEFAKTLAGLGDFYVNDAFGVCHRGHASIVGIPKHVPSCAGMLLQKEMEHLDRLFQNARKPFVLVVGGKKAADKAAMLDKFYGVADSILAGHLIEEEIKKTGIKITGAENIIYPLDGVEEGGRALDIGPETIKLFQHKILYAKTILWNGPVGMIEKDRFTAGTRAIAEAVIKSGAYSVVGGGETVEFLNREGLSNKFSHVSTGGGAMLAYLSGEKLPGLEALRS